MARYFCSVLLASSFLITPHPAYATQKQFSCILKAQEGKQITVKQNGSSYTGKYVSLLDCEQAQIDAGEAVIIYDIDGKTHSEGIERNKPISATSYLAKGTVLGSFGGVPQLLATLEAILRGDPRVKPGGKHATEQARVMGFPYDDIVAPKNDLNITLRIGDIRLLKQFQIVPEDHPRAPIYTQINITNNLIIPKHLIEPDKTYRWTAKAEFKDGEKQFNGRFYVLSAQDSEALNLKIEEEIQSSGDNTPLLRAIVTSKHLIENDYEFDALRVLAEIYK